MIKNKLIIIFLFCCLIITNNSFAQALVEDFDVANIENPESLTIENFPELLKKQEYPEPTLSVEKLSCREQILQVADKDFELRKLVYRPHRKSQRLMIIIPAIQGTNIIDRFYAYMFCRENYNVVILDHWTGDNERSLDLKMDQRLLERSQRAISLALKSEPKAQFNGILGSSLGAVYGAVASCLFPEVNAVFSIVGGVSLASVMADSMLPELVELRSKRFQYYGFHNREEYIRSLDKEILWDPLKIGTGFEDKKLGMVLATVDVIVPTPYQRLLKEFWKPEVYYKLPLAHVQAIVFTALFKTKKIIHFFEERYKLAKSI